MGGARLAAFTLAGSAAFAGLVPVALAAPGAAVPGAKPTPTTSHTSARPKPGGSKTPSTSPSNTAPPKPPILPCKTPPSFPASRMTGVPWAQTRLDFVKAWPITRGRGVKVAIVDSGVNGRHPQLTGRVSRNVDLTHTHNTDCFGHGTEVAGIIAAQDERNAAHPVSFVGVAPDVQLISIKDQIEGRGGDPALLAKGIRLAVHMGADIINVSATNTDYPDLRDAVRVAERHDVLIVAAAGNTDPRQKASEREEFPASYPSVLSVGAVGRDGLADFSNTTSRVDVTAPGEDIVSTAADGYFWPVKGTSYSAPYVAGVAALIKSAKPDLTAQQIKNRIIATADGSIGTGSGGGVVNTYDAVTALGDFSATPAPSRQPVAQPIDIGGPRPVDHRARKIGGLVAAGTLGLALLVIFGGVVTPIGIRRGWRPGRAAPIRDDSENSGD